MTGVPKGRPVRGTVDALLAERTRIVDAELLGPVLVIDRPALRRNIAAMAEFLDRLGVELAPHAKTHMSPALWRMQELAGATRCTVATVAQALVFIEAGVRSILIASEVTGRGDLAGLATALAADPALDVVVFCDSLAGVAALASAMSAEQTNAEVGVVVDVGPEGWRTGCRSAEEALAVARAASAAPQLRLVGAAGYEGVLWPLAEGRADAVADYLDTAVGAFLAIRDDDLLPDEPLLTFGGSDLYPAVLERVLPVARRAGARLLLRSGCYLFHDHGKYERAQDEVLSAVGKPRFEPTIGVWAPVVSTPEPDLAVLGLGRRDAGFDAGMPRPLRRCRSGAIEPLGAGEVRGLYDQHLVLAGARPVLGVGDLVEFGVSHPCTTLDRWRHAYLTEELIPVEVVGLEFP